MLAACEVAPDLPIALDDPTKAMALRDLCIPAVNALCDLERVGHQWTVYPNADAMGLSALAQAMRVLHGHPDEARWRATAGDIANAWLTARVSPRERSEPPPHFGRRVNPGSLTFVWPASPGVRATFYTSGLWYQA